MEYIKINRLRKEIKGTQAISDITLTLQKGENTAIVGETGSGKSTLLRTIAGLIQPDNGYVALKNKKILGPEEQLIPGNKAIAYLSQHFELPIHLRVEQVLEYANTLDPETEKALYHICHIQHLLKRKTHDLSGGEKQRIALVRLLLGGPEVLLLDEPFSNFDNIHKTEMMELVQDIADKWGITCVMVSHSPKDVLSWSHRILVMREGTVIQDGNPESVFRHPVNEYAAGLLGDFNLLSSNELLKMGGSPLHPGKQYVIRPEAFQISHPEYAQLQGTVIEKQFLGYGYQLTVNVKGIAIQVFTSIAYLQKGNKVYLQLSENDMTEIE